MPDQPPDPTPDAAPDTAPDTIPDTASDPTPDAAPDPAPEREEPGAARRRLAGSMLHPSRSQVVVGLLLAALGFAAVTQVRANELDDTYASYREQDLVDVLSTLTDASQRAQSELARLEGARRDLQGDNSRREAALLQAEQAASSLEILAGQVPVTGPGIRVEITELDGTVGIESLLDTVQELRTAGAEAMEFNDEVRIVAESAFTDGIGGIEVDGALLTSPYVIEVIGDPLTLEGALTFIQGPSDQLEEDGAAVEVLLLEELAIESVRPAGRPEYAEPVTEQ